MIVVTGGTGHIGNVLVRKLLDGDEKVRVIIPPFEDEGPLRGLDVEIFRADIRDKTRLIEAVQGATYVYHLAGMVSIMPGKHKLLSQVNHLGTRNVVEACLQTEVQRLLYTSSVHALEELPHGMVITESAAIDPEKVVGGYAQTKALATLEVRKGVQRGLDAVIVHPSGVIGPYEYKASKTSQLINQFLQGQMLFYLKGGYDFVDVRDVVAGMISACEKGRCGESYILSNEWISIEGILDLLTGITGKKPHSLKVPLWMARCLAPFTTLYATIRNKPPLLTSYSIYTICSNSRFSHGKATEELGYSTRPLQETLRDTIEWLSTKNIYS